MTDPIVGALADAPLLGLPLAELWFGLLVFLLGTFLFLDGFDFGAGALFALRGDDETREQVIAAIGPFWDGNEVWLVVFGGALFAAFPPAYAALFSRHYLLMFAILGALILRGLAPEMYEQRHDSTWQRWWGRAFVVGSVGAPLLLGTFVGNWLLGTAGTLTVAGPLVGVAVVALTVVHGAAFLRLKVRGDLRATLAREGQLAAGAYLVAIVVALAALYATAPALRPGLTAWPVLALVVATVVLAVGYALATRTDRYYLAFGASAALIYGLAAAVGLLLYPYIDRATGLTIGDAIVPTLALNLMTVAAALLLPFVIVYFLVLYSAFRGPIEAGETY
ncbi:MAG: cytochrome d ubiquinol oxidase subunit II [Haloarculaceae archaeon]